MLTRLYILLFVVLIINIPARSQQNIKKNNARQSVKDDDLNYYRSEDMSQLDVLEALDFAGIRVHKFKIGNFDTTYQITIIIEEFVNSKLKRTDTVFSRNNLYGFYEGEKKFSDYIDQIKIFSRQEGNISKGKVETYVGSDGFKLIGDTITKNRSYNWRSYVNSNWKLNKKIPLLIYASTWTDKEYGFERFCGVVNLRENDENTNELLGKSPHYFLFSYIVTDLK